MENSISRQNVNVNVRAVVTDPNVTVQYKTKVLQKNVVNGVNTLTPAMISEANIKYIIKYDYTLGEDITIPANCVLQFDGGSISGAYTITGTNTAINAGLVKIFGIDVTFNGSWSTKEILANWFDAANDSAMFNKASNFATSIYNQTQDYNRINLTITCITKQYYISDSINLPIFVSFNGNGSCFTPTNDLVNKYMFVCGSSELDYVTNKETELFNIRYSNPDSLISNMVLLYDSRRIHNIHAFRPARLIVCQSGKFIDNKHISDIVFTENANFRYDRTDPENTAAIYCYHGDSVEINNINDGVSICVVYATNIKISNCINPSVYNRLSHLIIDNCHNEGGTFDLDGDTTFENCTLYADGAKIYAYETDVRQKIRKTAFNNCRFVNIKHINNNELSVIDNKGSILFNNTMGIMSNGGAIIHNPYCMVKCGDMFVNPDRFQIDSTKITDDTKQFEWSKDIIAGFSHNNWGDTPYGYMRMLLLADKDKGLYIPIGDFSPSVEFSAPSNINMYVYQNGISKLRGSVIRIEAGVSQGVYTQYIDIGIVDSIEGFQVTYDTTNNKFQLRLNDILTDFSDISYTITYLECSMYSKIKNRVFTIINSSSLPTVSLFTKGDQIMINDNKLLTCIGSAWVDATGATV